MRARRCLWSSQTFESLVAIVFVDEDIIWSRSRQPTAQRMAPAAGDGASQRGRNQDTNSFAFPSGETAGVQTERNSFARFVRGEHAAVEFVGWGGRWTLLAADSEDEVAQRPQGQRRWALLSRRGVYGSGGGGTGIITAAKASGCRKEVREPGRRHEADTTSIWSLGEKGR